MTEEKITEETIDWLGGGGEKRATDERYLKIADPKEVDDYTETRMRIIDSKPVDVWQHWYNNRPYNCLGAYNGCPACKARNAAKVSDPNGYRDTHRMNRKWLIRAIVEDEVKIFSFSKKLGEKLKFFYQKNGDLQEYDVTIIKKRDGKLKFQVSYDAIPEPKSPLTAAQKVLIEENDFDLTAEIVPASFDDLQAAVNGVPSSGGGSTPTDGASEIQIMQLEALAKKKGYTLSDFGIDRNGLTSDRAAKFIAELEKVASS